MSVDRSAYFTADELLSKVNIARCIQNATTEENQPIFSIGLPQAAVLIPLCIHNGEVCLLYTKRSMTVGSHKGQVSFPGGMRDREDSTLIDTALRETEEELGIPRSSIEIWAQMNQTFPGIKFNVEIFPIIGFIKDFDSIQIKMNELEVEDVFVVTLKKLSDKRNIIMETVDSGWTMPVFNAGKYKIWGVTAIITQYFLSYLLSLEIYDRSSYDVKFKSSL